MTLSLLFTLDSNGKSACEFGDVVFTVEPTARDGSLYILKRADVNLTLMTGVERKVMDYLQGVHQGWKAGLTIEEAIKVANIAAFGGQSEILKRGEQYGTE